jgi:hypothetical protein
MVARRVAVCARNPHAHYIAAKIEHFRSSARFWKRWSIIIARGTSRASFVRCFSTNVFSGLVRDTFTTSYVHRFLCASPGCRRRATDRCHDARWTRPVLLRRALRRAWPSPRTTTCKLGDIMLAFLEEHLDASLLFKCNSCHIAENKHKRTSVPQLPMRRLKCNGHA